MGHGYTKKKTKPHPKSMSVPVVMDNNINQRRTIVFGVIYVRTLDLYSRYIHRPLRWGLELFTLFMALLTLLVWVYVHHSYILQPADCLEQITQRPFPRDVILQVEVYSNSSYLWEKRNQALLHLYQTISSRSLREHQAIDKDDVIKTLEDAVETLEIDINQDTKELGSDYCDYALLDFLGLQSLCKSLVNVGGESSSVGEVELPDVDLEKRLAVDISSEVEKNNSNSEPSLMTSNDIEESDSISEEVDVSKTITGSKPSWSSVVMDAFWTDSTKTQREKFHSDFYAENYTLYELFDFYSLKLLSLDYSLLEFTQEAGFLSLTTATRARLNISVVKVYIDPDQTSCFGGAFGNFITKYFIGYDMMVISSFKNLLPEGVGSGYVKDLLTGSHYYYRVQWMGKWRYLAGLLPAMFFTLVASVLLREVHYHVFKFLTHFQHLLNQGIPMPVQTGAQIPFLIVTYAAIGLIIVMSEALSDDSMFSLLMVATVWEVDQFYAIYCRHQTSKMYFPWFFFLYHFMSYAYFVRFNGQFWFLPFLFHWLMTQHAMLFFINHCELPLEGVRLRIFLGPNHPAFIRRPVALVPHPAGAQPDLNDQGPPPPVRAQPDVHHQAAPPPNFDIVAQDQPAEVPPPVNNDEVEAQNNTGPQEIILPSGRAPESVRRRLVGVASQNGVESQGSSRSMFVEESRSDEGSSEFVSGSSTQSLFRSDPRHLPRHPRSMLSDTELLERPGGRGILSRESIRTARLNRFVGNSNERDSNSSNTDYHTQ